MSVCITLSKAQLILAARLKVIQRYKQIGIIRFRHRTQKVLS